MTGMRRAGPIPGWKGAVLATLVLFTSNSAGAESRPVYAVGDRVHLDNGRVETVVAVDGDRVTWELSNGAREVRFWNFLLPTVERFRGDERTTRAVAAEPDLLWPLRRGADAGFRVAYRKQRRSRSGKLRVTERQRRWHCRIGAAGRVVVAAGAFDTIAVACERFNAYGTSTREVAWDYAPELGHWVQRSGGTRPRGLVATWPAAAGTGFDAAFQEAMENVPSGNATAWRDPATGVARIVPVETLRRSSGGYCRRYTIDLETRGGAASRRYAGLVCRDSRGRWSIPASP